MKKGFLIILIIAVAAVGSFVFMKQSSSPQDQQGNETAENKDLCPHKLPAEKCPFCTPSLIESMVCRSPSV